MEATIYLLVRLQGPTIKKLIDVGTSNNFVQLGFLKALGLFKDVGLQGQDKNVVLRD